MDYIENSQNPNNAAQQNQQQQQTSSHGVLQQNFSQQLIQQKQALQKKFGSKANIKIGNSRNNQYLIGGGGNQGGVGSNEYHSHKQLQGANHFAPKQYPLYQKTEYALNNTVINHQNKSLHNQATSKPRRLRKNYEMLENAQQISKNNTNGSRSQSNNNGQKNKHLGNANNLYPSNNTTTTAQQQYYQKQLNQNLQQTDLNVLNKQGQQHQMQQQQIALQQKNMHAHSQMQLRGDQNMSASPSHLGNYKQDSLRQLKSQMDQHTGQNQQPHHNAAVYQNLISGGPTGNNTQQVVNQKNLNANFNSTKVIQGRKNSYYEAITLQQPGASKTQQNLHNLTQGYNNTQNMSMYSQINIKESASSVSPDKAKKQVKNLQYINAYTKNNNFIQQNNLMSGTNSSSQLQNTSDSKSYTQIQPGQQFNYSQQNSQQHPNLYIQSNGNNSQHVTSQAQLQPYMASSNIASTGQNSQAALILNHNQQIQSQNSLNQYMQTQINPQMLLNNNNTNNKTSQQQTNSQQVLNIQTANDINIYNNQFIVKTGASGNNQQQQQLQGTKGQKVSTKIANGPGTNAIQSRSSSVKRGAGQQQVNNLHSQQQQYQQQQLMLQQQQNMHNTTSGPVSNMILAPNILGNKGHGQQQQLSSQKNPTSQLNMRNQMYKVESASQNTKYTTTQKKNQSGMLQNTTQNPQQQNFSVVNNRSSSQIRQGNQQTTQQGVNSRGIGNAIGSRSNSRQGVSDRNKTQQNNANTQKMYNSKNQQLQQPGQYQTDAYKNPVQQYIKKNRGMLESSQGNSRNNNVSQRTYKFSRGSSDQGRINVDTSMSSKTWVNQQDFQLNNPHASHQMLHNTRIDNFQIQQQPSVSSIDKIIISNQTSQLNLQKKKIHQEQQMQKEKDQKIAQWLQSGKSKLVQKNYKEATEQFEKILEIDFQNVDALFYRALSNLDSGNINEANGQLKNVLEISPDHSQITYILLSIAYKRQGEEQEAQDALTKCIQKFPDYSEAYLARGQSYLAQDKFEESLQDFKMYYKLVPTKGIGLIGIGDSQKSLKQFQLAVDAYTSAIKLYENQQQASSQTKKGNSQQQSAQNKQEVQQLLSAYMKRAISYFQQKEYTKSKIDFEKIIKSDHSNVKAHFYLGKILSKSYNQDKQSANDAILHFEQVAKYPQHEFYCGNALFSIAKLRLAEKDFYEAYFSLKRAIDYNFSSKRLQMYKDFTEGVLYLIKRKIKKGVQILSDLLEILVNNKDITDRSMVEYLTHQIYVYRSYGYVAIEKYEIAIDDIKKAKKIGPVCTASIYNKWLGRGILRMDHEDYLMASKYFTNASQHFPANKDTYCLQVISIVRSYCYSLKNHYIDEDIKFHKVADTRKFMEKAIRNVGENKEASLYFFRGLLNFQLHEFHEALKDFNKAIELEEESTAFFYLARGRCYACLSILTEAMKDLSIALNLDETLQDAYIYRGKCAYLLGDNNLAFLDFQRLILSDPKNPMVHVYAGNLLMTTGAYKDAIKAFENADTVMKTSIASFQRVRCHAALNQIESAYEEIKETLRLQPDEVLVKFDSICLKNLIYVQDALKQNVKDLKQVLTKSKSKFNDLIKKYEDGTISLLKKKDCLLNMQIIPSVKRIKHEKVNVLKELVIQQQNEGNDTSSIELEVNQLNDTQNLANLPIYSYYNENIFALEDLYMYRGLISYYLGEYDQAIKDYQRAIQAHHKSNESQQKQNDEETMVLYSQSRSVSPNMSMNSTKTDLSDVGLCSLNKHESNYNILLCHLLQKNSEKAILVINEMMRTLPKKYVHHFFLLRGLLYQMIKEDDKAAKDLTKFQNYEPQLYQQLMANKTKPFDLDPFPPQDRLCENFIYTKITLGGTKENQHQFTFNIRPSFSMPFVKPPNMIPNIHEESLQEEFNLKQIDAPMPEAPWIKRCEHGIKFTDEMHPDENENLEATQDNKQQSKSKAQNLQHDDPQNDYDDTNNNDQLKPTSNKDKLYSQKVVNLSQNHPFNRSNIIEPEDGLSDKNKLSLFDESKFGVSINHQHNHICSLDKCDEKGNVNVVDDLSDQSVQTAIIKHNERDSMVNLGENMYELNLDKQKAFLNQINFNESNDLDDNGFLDNNDQGENPLSEVSIEIQDPGYNLRKKIFSDLESQMESHVDDEMQSEHESRKSHFRESKSGRPGADGKKKRTNSNLM